jgi:hypothetical protein
MLFLFLSESKTLAFTDGLELLAVDFFFFELELLMLALLLLLLDNDSFFFLLE